MKKMAAFTLIEILIALSIIAIALTALIKATSQDVAYTERLKEKSISHWVEMQGVTMIQLGLVALLPNQDITEVTTMLGESWYWRAHLEATPLKHIQKVRITVSKNQSGPFMQPLYAYKYAHES